VDLKELINIQKEFDKEHGWVIESDDKINIIEAINKDLIGLFGEVGEFSNIIKKINLRMNNSNLSDSEMEEIYIRFEEQLSEELIDSFIYLFRIATHLNLDVTSTYLKKLEYNKKRFKKYESKTEE
jgi:NTP pyrophosphatase (non-canonical NTP hydrolase)